MSEKYVKVINNKDRYFNGARKGQILQIPKEKLNDYLLNGFSLFKSFEEKVNIVKEPTDKKVKKTKKELIAILEHNGVDFDKSSKVSVLEELVLKLEEKTSDTTKVQDIEELKTKLVEEAILSQEEMESKNGKEIIELATENGLI